jgi:hypothetical protein
MPRAALPLLILGCVVVAAAAAWLTLTRGSGAGGEVVADHRPMAPFQRVDLTGTLDVTLMAAPREEVVVETPAGLQSRVRARVENGVLTITGGEPRRWWGAFFGRSRAGFTPKITVHYRTLDAIELSGAVKLAAARIEAGDLRIAASGGTTVRIDDLQARALRLSGSGALKATIGGRVVDQTVSISGAGEVLAERLASDNAKVSVSGAGSIVLRAEKTLNASISGAGSVEYYGDPEVRQQISGVGRVKRRESARAQGGHVAARDVQWSASARNSSGTPVSPSRSACTPGSTRTSVTRQSASSVASICTTSATRSTA